MMAPTSMLALGISPLVVSAGSLCTLTITSSGDFDLSGVGAAQVGINPATGISNLTVSNQSPSRLTLSFKVASDVPTGTRLLTIIANNVSASANFNVVESPQISISPNRVVAAGTPNTLRVNSEGFDLSNVVREQIRIVPATDIIHLGVSNQSERSLTLSLSFDLENIQAIARQLTITVNNVSASAKFEVLPT